MIVDAGCGVGVLTSAIAEVAVTAIGVDPSRESISLAKRHFGFSAVFVQSTLEDYAADHECVADVIVMNMVLISVPNWAVLAAAYRLLRPAGSLILSMPHPWFWSLYNGCSGEPWFRYDQEIIIESPFRIAMETDCDLPSTFVHRSLEFYISAFAREGFSMDILRVRMPSPTVNALYPRPWNTLDIFW